MRGIVIAGTHSGCGKTTITLGILAALKAKGLRVHSFKTGPDFIDAGLHRLITGTTSRNLDLWMCGEEEVRRSFSRAAAEADVAVVEGVMGMYDGEYSTARLARTLGLPVLLVIDAYGMAESAGAIAKGFADYGAASAPAFAGVVFNRVASERHYRRVKDAVKDMPVLGYLPREIEFEIPHRHLGLTTVEESPLSAESIKKLADVVLAHIDIDTALEAGRQLRPETAAQSAASQPSLRLALARDTAFCFYYEDNLDLLRNAGIEIVPFSPLSDPALPAAVDAVYIGGGYPELHAAALSRNSSMRASLRDWAETGNPLYAECGGLMFLSKGIYDFEGAFYPMAGIFPFETQMKKRRARLGYREITLKEDCFLGKQGERCRGHEFHYSEITGNGGVSPHRLYAVTSNTGETLPDEGYGLKRTLASYVHVHFGSNAAVARNVVQFIKEGR